MRFLLIAGLTVTGTALRFSPVSAFRSSHYKCVQRSTKVFAYQDQYATAYPQSQLPFPWEQLVDQNGQVYYSNPQTGVTSWDPPPAESGQQDQGGYANDQYAQQGYAQHNDVQQGYQQQGYQQQEFEQQAYVQDLPAGWTSGFDQSCGATYYYNEHTGQSQWEPPHVGAPPAENTPQQGAGTQVTWKVASVSGWGPRFAGKYTLRHGGTFYVALGRYDMEISKPTRPWVSREQCVIQLQPDGTATLESRGKAPTLFRNRGGTWYALEKGEGLTLSEGDQVSVDYNDPEGTVFTCTQEWS